MAAADIRVGRIRLRDDEIEMTAIAASGPGGQHVNKTATAIQLRFDIRASSLPASVQHRLLQIPDARITRDGVLIIKAQEFRSQARNREAAIARLCDLVRRAASVPRPRIPTRPTVAADAVRLEGKTRRAKQKRLRRPVTDD